MSNTHCYNHNELKPERHLYMSTAIYMTVNIQYSTYYSVRIYTSQ